MSSPRNIPVNCLRLSSLKLLLLVVQAAGQLSHPWILSSADGINRLIVNVGARDDPPIPFNGTDSAVNGTTGQSYIAGVLAIEARPEAVNAIPDVPNRWKIAAAVGPHFGLATFNHYDDSSSLLEPDRVSRGGSMHWDLIRNKGQRGKKMIVPTVPLQSLLSRINVTLWYLKTDTQGMDFRVVKSAGDELRRFSYVYAETWCNGFTSYLDAENDFDKHWLPYMTYMGFEPVDGPNFCAQHPHQGELNCLWRNKQPRAPLLPLPTREQCAFCWT